MKKNLKEWKLSIDGVHFRFFVGGKKLGVLEEFGGGDFMGYDMPALGGSSSTPKYHTYCPSLAGHPGTTQMRSAACRSPAPGLALSHESGTPAAPGALAARHQRCWDAAPSFLSYSGLPRSTGQR